MHKMHIFGKFEKNNAQKLAKIRIKFYMYIIIYAVHSWQAFINTFTDLLISFVGVAGSVITKAEESIAQYAPNIFLSIGFF